jgi:ubiquinone/menaquinone biosynthesis C-methylase UbiE
MQGRITTQFEPADETSSASLHALAPLGALGIDVLSKTTRGRIAAEPLRGKPPPIREGSAVVGAESAEYVLGHSTSELERQTVEARAFQSFTRELLIEAGVEKGMRVLEVGTGAGDVAMLAADLVGPTGTIVAVDKSCATVELARERARLKGVQNVSFECADPQESLSVGNDFDALVGRLVLMYMRSPAVTLRRLVRHLRPGGIVAFQEINTLGARTVPPIPTHELAQTWIRETFLRSGVEIQMGPKLHAVFRGAGLPAPQMRVDGLIGGSESIVPALMADVIRSILPLIVQFGLATESAVDIETLEDRLRAELEAADGSISSPLLIGAWAKLPQ